MDVKRLGGEYVGVYQGRWAPNNTGIGVAHSYNGEQFEPEPTAAWDSTQWTTTDPQTFSGGSPILTRLRTGLSILYHDRGTGHIHALPYDSRHTPIHQAGEVVYRSPSWTSNNVAPDATVVDDSYIYLIYHDTVTAGRNIGIARASRGDLYV
jgi:hypothetical protein